MPFVWSEIVLPLVWLFVLAIPIACISWTVTHEEIFRPVREFCLSRSKESKYGLTRKFYYMLTCEYCFSHYVTLVFVALTGYKLLLDDWRGFLVSGFSLVGVANVYLSLYSFLRTDLKKEKIQTQLNEKKIRDADSEDDLPPESDYHRNG